MPTVTIFRFQKYNISNDENQMSRRWGTRQAVARVGGELLEHTAVEVDTAVLGREIEGMTDRISTRGSGPAFKPRLRNSIPSRPQTPSVLSVRLASMNNDRTGTSPQT
jgi:hypothetical protein